MEIFLFHFLTIGIHVASSHPPTCASFSWFYTITHIKGVIRDKGTCVCQGGSEALREREETGRAREKERLPL